MSQEGAKDDTDGSHFKYFQLGLDDKVIEEK